MREGSSVSTAVDFSSVRRFLRLPAQQSSIELSDRQAPNHPTDISVTLLAEDGMQVSYLCYLLVVTVNRTLSMPASA
jgi:hypothetical protein